MKKFSSLLLVLFLILSTLALTVSATPALVVGSGDVNGDGDVNEFDYLVVKRACFDTYTLTSDEFSAVDIDQNGSVDQFDYLCIKRHHFGTYVIGSDEDDTVSIEYTSHIFPGVFYADYSPETDENVFVINTRAELYELLEYCEGEPYTGNGVTDFGKFAIALPTDYFDTNTLVVIHVRSPKLLTEYAFEDVSVNKNECTVSYTYKYPTGYTPEGVQNTLLVAEFDKGDVNNREVKTNAVQIENTKPEYNTESRNIEYTQTSVHASINSSWDIQALELISDIENPTVFVINTRTELELLQKYCDALSETILRYDEEFFEEKSLILTHVTSGSGGDIYWYNGISADENGITIDIYSNTSGMTMDFYQRFHIAEVDKSDVAGVEKITKNKYTERMVALTYDGFIPLQKDEEEYILELLNNTEWIDTKDVLVYYPEYQFICNSANVLYYVEENLLVNGYNGDQHALSPDEKAVIDSILQKHLDEAK